MAKLRPEQLTNSIKKRLSLAYVITGDEPLLVQEACDLVRHTAKSYGYTERELYHSDSGFKWETLLQSANSPSLFAEKKIIEIRIDNGKPGDAGSKAIVSYCENPSEDTLLLLVFPKLDKRSQNTKWFKALDKIGDIVTIWPISLGQMPRWVELRMQKAGLSADPQAIEMLCAKTEGNLLAADQEIQKLKLVTDDKHISHQTMSTAVSDSARFDVFSLVDKTLHGDARSAAHALQGLRAEGIEPPIILWAIAREIRSLAGVKESLDLGESFQLAARKHGIWENRKPLIKQALTRLTTPHLHTLLRKASIADKTIKGAAKGDVWNLLLDMTLAIAGTHALDKRSQKMEIQNQM